MENSKIAIILAFKEIAAQKSIDKITVEKIISLANISRQTFYKYFADKYDLAFQMFSYDHSNSINPEDNFYARQVSHLKMLSDNRACYKNIMKDAHLQESFMQRRFEYCCGTVYDTVGKKSMTPTLKLVIETWITGTERLFERWVLNGC
ncbi:MAG: TetR family transcriptional regulator [Oscillospiraceae bacterium]|jgi:AcrR family transcriptional regulator|nr:TetR family transcriptional regulator [Oscillospiraceae bacterium]